MSETKSQGCVQLLRWALPRLSMRWEGFRKPRRQVCRRVRQRYRELDLESYQAYRRYLEEHPEEWEALDRLCRVTISRFFRDRRLFEQLGDLLAELEDAADGRRLRIWSAGCASGEEPYSVLLAAEAAELAYPVDVVATDADPHMLERARRARYPIGTLRELDDETIVRAFDEGADGELQLRREIADRARFECQDIRDERPEGRFDVILCRNLAFTYFDRELQERIAAGFAEALVPGGALVIGSHERLPDSAPFEPWPGRRMTYRRAQ